MRLILSILFLVKVAFLFAQPCAVKGKVTSPETGEGLESVMIIVEGVGQKGTTNKQGQFELTAVPKGQQTFIFYLHGYEKLVRKIEVTSDTVLELTLHPIQLELSEIVVKAEKENEFSLSRLNNVEGTAIYAGKKTEVINIQKINANLATNNSRQIFSRVAGLNIWESDGGGLQLGIGGRGLSPNRTSNFNTRQNGYDMAADALGYPESYYSPPAEMIDRIEVVRGASSLQYGTQFGGVVNFVLKKGPSDRPFALVSRQTIGSFGLSNSFLSVGGTHKKITYYSAFQYKFGNGWRDNSGFDQKNSFSAVSWQLSDKSELSAEYTYMSYLAQQPGGLTDVLFEKDPRQSIRERNWFKVNWNLFSLSFNHKFNPRSKLNVRNFGLLASRAAVGFLGNISRIDPGGNRDLIFGDFKNIGNETRFLHRYSLGKNIGVLLVGARFYAGTTSSRQGFSTSGNDAVFTFNNPDDVEGSDYKFPSRNLAFFAENIFYITEKLSVTPGVRMEYIGTFSDGFFKQRTYNLAGDVIYEEKVITSTERERWVPLAGLGISAKPLRSLEVYANISQNYRAINFSDLQIVNPNYRVDPSIVDENGFTLDGGFRGVFKNVITFDASLFYIDYRNRIGEILQVDPATLNLYRFRTNVSDSYSRGAEIFSEVDITRLFSDSLKFSVSVFGNLSLIDARYVDSDQSAFADKKVELVPPVLFRTGLSFRWGEFSMSAQYSYTGEQFSDATNATFSPNSVSGVIPEYSVMDLSAGYSFKKWIRLEAGINNLLDEKYFTRRATGYPGPGILPSDGRSFYFTLQFKY